MSYSDSEGLPIAYLFHKELLKRSLKAASFCKGESAHIGQGKLTDGEIEEKRVTDMLSYREELLMWLVNLMRSPLPKKAKVWCV